MTGEHSSEGAGQPLTGQTNERWNPVKAETIGRVVNEVYSKGSFGSWEDHERFGPPTTESPEARVSREKTEAKIEELYEINPILFASMPTKELAAIFSELLDIQGHVRLAELKLAEAYRDRDEFYGKYRGISSAPTEEPSTPEAA